jgi:hypothetical protein
MIIKTAMIYGKTIIKDANYFWRPMCLNKFKKSYSHEHCVNFIKKSIQYDELLILQKAIDERKRELKKDFPI